MRIKILFWTVYFNICFNKPKINWKEFFCNLTRHKLKYVKGTYIYIHYKCKCGKNQEMWA